MNVFLKGKYTKEQIIPVLARHPQIKAGWQMELGFDGKMKDCLFLTGSKLDLDKLLADLPPNLEYEL